MSFSGRKPDASQGQGIHLDSALRIAEVGGGLLAVAMVTGACSPTTAAPAEATKLPPVDTTVPGETPPATATGVTSPLSSPTAEATATSSPVPQATEKPTAVPLPELKLEGMTGLTIVPQESITVAASMYEKVTGIPQAEMKIEARVFHTSTGQAFAAYVDTAHNNTPLFITAQNAEGKNEWQVATLENVAATQGITVATLVQNSQFEKYPLSKEIVESEFSGIILSDVGLAYTNPNGPGEPDFSYADMIVAFAHPKNGKQMNVIGQHLVSMTDLAPWLVNGLQDGTYTKEQVMTILIDHMTTVMHRYPDIKIWTTLNEAWVGPEKCGWDVLYNAFTDNGKHPEKRMDYVIQIFEAARSANPDAILLYSDLENEVPGKRADENMAIVQALKQKGLIDGLAMHMRIDAANPPTEDGLVQMMKSYGVPIYITEKTIDLTNLLIGDERPGAEEFRIQQDINRLIARAAVRSGVCHYIADWGIQDSRNWLVKDRNRPFSAPSMYDDNLNRKPSYYGELQGLMPTK